MPQNFLFPQRDQPLLLPVDMREWLPEDDLVFVVLDAVATLDLGAFYARYRADGHGRAAFDPEMMVALLLYGYCQGERSGTVALVDRGWLETEGVTAPGSASVFAGFRFPREVISVAVRWYLRYGLSYRDVEELLAERGVTVDHVSVYRWVQRFTPEFIEAARPCRHAPGDRWFADETYVKVAGQWAYLYRAIDQHGQVIDVLLSPRRDLQDRRQLGRLCS